MAGTLTISTLSDGTNSTSTTNCIQGSAKAWVNFIGSATPTVRASYNVTSVTFTSTGVYNINYTTAFANSGVVVTACCSNYSADRVATVELLTVNTTTVQIRTGVSGATAQTGIFFNPTTVTVLATGT